LDLSQVCYYCFDTVFCILYFSGQMTHFGGVRYSRAVRGAVWTQFREGGAALVAIQAGVVTVGGVEWKVCVIIL
jgi:hypothetical protein